MTGGDSAGVTILAKEPGTECRDWIYAQYNEKAEGVLNASCGRLGGDGFEDLLFQ